MSTAVNLNDYREAAVKDFTSFALDCGDPQAGAKLVKGFKKSVLAGDAAALNEWFVQQGYQITREECDKLIENKENLVKFKEHVMKAAY